MILFLVFLERFESFFCLLAVRLLIFFLGSADLPFGLDILRWIESAASVLLFKLVEALELDPRLRLLESWLLSFFRLALSLKCPRDRVLFLQLEVSLHLRRAQSLIVLSRETLCSRLDLVRRTRHRCLFLRIIRPMTWTSYFILLSSH